MHHDDDDDDDDDDDIELWHQYSIRGPGAPSHNGHQRHFATGGSPLISYFIKTRIMI